MDSRPGPPFLDAVVAEIGDKDRPVLGDRDGDRLVELPASAAFSTEGREERPVRCKFLDTVIVEIRDEDAFLPAEPLTSADSNHIAPLARSVPVAGKRGFVGSTAAWQPLSADSLYPAIESARPRSREPHKIRVISAHIEFLGETAVGYTTKRDLSGRGSFFFMALIGIIIAMIVNWFLASPALYFAISVIGVVVFVGLMAYDTQNIKEMYLESDATAVASKKLVSSVVLSASRLHW